MLRPLKLQKKRNSITQPFAKDYATYSNNLLFNLLGTLPLVRSFVSARQISRTTGLKDGLVEGEPVWPLIFYCLRCGDVNAALQATKQAG